VLVYHFTLFHFLSSTGPAFVYATGVFMSRYSSDKATCKHTP